MVAAIEAALVAEAKLRHDHPDDWIERERSAVAAEANRWATSYGLLTITSEDVERVEGRAVGHIDYARKLALYVAELIWSGAIR